MDAATAAHLLLLALAWTASLLVRPWRLLQPHRGQVALATPLLASLVVLPWLWAWPGLGALPVALHWSGAPLVVMLLGWPLAVPVITFAGLSTLFTVGATPEAALSLTVWSGLLPATLVLVLGQLVRHAFGPNPVAYVMGRGFFVPMLALLACSLASALMGHGLAGPQADLQRIALSLMALGEAAWSCAIVSLLVACRPQWRATWSDPMALGHPAPVRVRARGSHPRR